MSGLTKLYIGKDLKDLGNEWTYSNTSWEAMTKLALLQLDEVRIERDFQCVVGLNSISSDDIITWLTDQSIDVGKLTVVNVVHM